MASRHKARILAMMGLYQIDLVNQELANVLKFDYYDKPLSQEEKEYAEFLIKGVVENQKEIDKYIQESSQNWELSRISLVNRAILRLSIFSLMKEPMLPYKVIIDEALELAREYEDNESIRFINGILDSIRKKLGRTQEESKWKS